MLQGPAPLPPIVAIGTGPPVEAIIIITLAALTAATIILFPLVRAFARRLSGVDRGRVEELEARVADLEHERVGSGNWDGLQRDLLEVQERLDFTERLLARAQLPKAELPGGETGESQSGLRTPR